MKRSLLVLIISLYGKKRFSREHTKNPNANVPAHLDVTIWAVGYHFPPRVQTSFSHILCKIGEHTYVQNNKLELAGERTKSDNSSPKIKRYFYGNYQNYRQR